MAQTSFRLGRGFSLESENSPLGALLTLSWEGDDVPGWEGVPIAQDDVHELVESGAIQRGQAVFAMSESRRDVVDLLGDDGPLCWIQLDLLWFMVAGPEPSDAAGPDARASAM